MKIHKKRTSKLIFNKNLPMKAQWRVKIVKSEGKKSLSMKEREIINKK